jgi:Kef-type K+ transport system membrane component KefB
MGFAMSSTAIGLASLSEKNLLQTPGGQASFAVLLFQDLAVIPLLLVVTPSCSAVPARNVSRWDRETRTAYR